VDALVGPLPNSSTDATVIVNHTRRDKFDRWFWFIVQCTESLL
jgi:hypothetical protein